MPGLASWFFIRRGAQALGLLYLGKIRRRGLATVAAVFWSLVLFELLLQEIVLLSKFCIDLLLAFKLIDQFENNRI